MTPDFVGASQARWKEGTTQQLVNRTMKAKFTLNKP